jgi:hypothetical protein
MIRKNEMGGFIALYVTACLNLGNPGSCVTEFITDSTQNQMTMTELSLPKTPSDDSRSAANQNMMAA